MEDDEWYGVELMYNLVDELKKKKSPLANVVEYYNISREPLKLVDSFIKFKLAKYEWVRESTRWVKTKMLRQFMPMYKLRHGEPLVAEVANFESLIYFHLRIVSLGV